MGEASEKSGFMEVERDTCAKKVIVMRPAISSRGMGSQENG